MQEISRISISLMRIPIRFPDTKSIIVVRMNQQRIAEDLYFDINDAKSILHSFWVPKNTGSDWKG